MISTSSKIHTWVLVLATTECERHRMVEQLPIRQVFPRLDSKLAISVRLIEVLTIRRRMIWARCDHEKKPRRHTNDQLHDAVIIYV